jgi:hypothetical protein
MDADRNAFLIVGAALSAIAAALHIGCIFFGAPWYRCFGAGARPTWLNPEVGIRRSSRQ